MASIAPSDMYLKDMWPGPYNPHMSIPTDGWDSTKIGAGNNNSVARFTPGTKIMSMNEVTISSKGLSTVNTGGYGMIYLKYVCGTTALDVSATDVMCLYCGTDGGDGHLACSRDMSGSNETVLGAPCAIAVADITPNAYGWFWCDGQAPLEDCTALDVTGIVSDGSITSSQPIVLGVAASHATLSVIDSSNSVIIGWALKDDT